MGEGVTLLVALFLAFPAKAETSEVRIGLQYGFIYLPLEGGGRGEADREAGEGAQRR
jgi:hypothetical protein